ncbi:MAG: hypothetical protein JW857_08015 [Bacteroidales bacterium]|nr:hypothetical protein [Bacteroidales bacterium]
MKKTLAILTLILFAFNAGGYLIVFKIKQYQYKTEIKQQIKGGISDENLTVIALNSETRAQIRWKDKHEFIYKGQMYDVVRRVEDKNGNTFLYCITDYQETLLFADLNNLANKKQSENQENAFKNLVKLIAPLDVLADFKRSIHLNKSDLKPKYRFVYNEPSLEIQIPPPKNV